MQIKSNISPIIGSLQLGELMESDKNLVVVDASSGPSAKTNYDKKHLEGAIFVDLNLQLADIKENPADGGRHPLPSLEAFAKTLGHLGIHPESHVVIYDDKNGANAAARFWWMLVSIGHEKVQVLDGGLQAAMEAGFPISDLPFLATAQSDYPVQNWNLPVSDIQEVEKVSMDKDYLIIDVRESKRYDGEYEPIDLIAGHIPGAINVPFTSNLDENGLFLSAESLKIKYLSILEHIHSENRIVHCGSGVTACHTLLAMAYAGLEIPKLYVGSWSEWSRNDKAIAKSI